jgi:TP901 family phage tail tape measure protein
MGAEYAVSYVFKARNEVSPAFADMRRGSKRMEDAAVKSFRRMSREASMFKSVLGANLLGNAISRGVGLVTRGAGEVINEYVKFDDAIAGAVAKFGTGIKRGSEEFEALGAVAREVGGTTKFFSSEAAKGLEYLAMAGFTADQSIALLPKTSELAIVANMDLARATDIASDAIGAFGLATEDTTQLSANFARVNDVAAKTIVTSNTDLEQWFETVKMAGPVVTTAGGDIEEFSALTGKMANAGIKGSLAGTALKNMYLNMSAPVGKTRSALQKLGIETKDSNGNLLKMADILGQVDFATRKMGTAQRGAVLDALFGKRAVAGASKLMREGRDSLVAYTEQLRVATGAASDMADVIGDSLGNKIKTLQSAAIETGFKILEAFAGDGRKGIEDITASIREFDVKPIVDGIKEAIDGAKWLYKTIRDNTAIIKAAVKIWIAWKVSMTAIDFALRARELANLTRGFASMVNGMGAVRDNYATTEAAAAKSINGQIGGVNRLSKALGGLGALSMAFYTGWEAGTALFEKYVDPAQKESFKKSSAVDDRIRRADDALRTGGVQELAKAQKETGYEGQKAVLDSLRTLPNAIFSAATMLTPVGAAAKLATGVETPIETYGRQKSELQATNIEVSKALAEAAQNNIRSQQEALEYVAGATTSLDEFKLATDDIIGPMQTLNEVGYGLNESFVNLQIQMQGLQGTIEAVNAQVNAKRTLSQKVGGDNEPTPQTFEGKITLAGAPPGTKYENKSKKGAPKVNVEMAGAN